MQSFCEPFIKIKTRIQKLKAQGDSSYIYRNKVGKAFLQQDMSYRDIKGLPRRMRLTKYYMIRHGNCNESKECWIST